jgi:hypothetical protein
MQLDAPLPPELTTALHIVAPTPLRRKKERLVEPPALNGPSGSI